MSHVTSPFPSSNRLPKVTPKGTNPSVYLAGSSASRSRRISATSRSASTRTRSASSGSARQASSWSTTAFRSRAAHATDRRAQLRVSRPTRVSHVRPYDPADVPENPDELLSVGEAARLLGVARSTMWRYVRDGLLPARQLPSGHYRIRRGDLERYRMERDGEDA